MTLRNIIERRREFTDTIGFEKVRIQKKGYSSYK
jgi:hypothetical protein